MKIAQIVCVYPPYKGGIGNVAYNFKKYLPAAGCDVSVYTPLYGDRSKSTGDDNVFFKKPFLHSGNGAFLPQIFTLIKNYDIVHLHYPFFGTTEIVWLSTLVRQHGPKLVLHYHMDTAALSPINKVLSLPSVLIKKSLFKQAAAITCANLDYIKHSSIKDIYNEFPHKFHEVSFGVNRNIFKHDSAVPKIEGRLFFVANLDKAHNFKGLDVLLRSLKELNDKSAHLYVGGDGDMKKTYINFAKKIGVGDKVVFLGKLSQDELVKNYRQANATILPSTNTHEAFGLVLLESMACATPVIASCLPGVRKVFEDGVQGYLCEPGSLEDLTDKIKKLLNHPDKKAMGRRGEDLINSKYSWPKTAKSLYEVYKNIL